MGQPGAARARYARQIVGYLKRRCLADGQTPICSCAIDNAASRKALEANGYVAMHGLLEYRFSMLRPSGGSALPSDFGSPAARSSQQRKGPVRIAFRSPLEHSLFPSSSRTWR